MSTTEATPEEVDDTVVSDDAREGILTELTAALGDSVLESHLMPGLDLWVRVDAAAWRAVGEAARDQMGFNYFCFLSAIDWMPSPFGRSMDSDVDTFLGSAAEVEGAEEPAAEEEMTTGYAGGSSRFQILARLYSIERKIGFTLKADLDDAQPSIDSWVEVFGGANWHEREAYEMFGIDFPGHPSLRNIYLPGDFEGNPLRKDFPLLSRHVKPWPGIVDVEGMPDEDGPDGDATDEGSGDE